MFDFYFPYFVVYVVCAVGIYSPYILEHKFNLIILEEVRFLITFHTMLHTFFGKLFEFYRKYSWYDDVLHVLGGMLLAFIAMPLFYSVELNYSTFTKRNAIKSRYRPFNCKCSRSDVGDKLSSWQILYL